MLLYLHGALGTQRQFDVLRTHLDGLALDFEGHGEQPPSPRPFAISHFVENVIATLDQHAIDCADLVGYSMGGYVALLTALLHPTRVGKVFTLATKFDWTPESAARETALLDPDTMQVKVPAYVANLEQQHPVANWRTVVDQTRALLHSLGDQPPLTPHALARISQHVRIGLGDRDKMVSIEESVAAYRALPHAEFQILPNTPHPLERVDMGLLAGAIRQFMGD